MKYSKNPVTETILSLLEETPSGISLYDIVKNTAFPHDLIPDEDDQNFNDLHLFRKNFIVMNALYCLQNELLKEENLYLEISPIKIFISEQKRGINSIEKDVSVDSSLAEYYLNWDNMEETTKEDVDKLLESFWKMYLSTDRRSEALVVLGLERNASNQQIKSRYRKLASENHPDRGGNNESFIKIRKAYEILRN